MIQDCWNSTKGKPLLPRLTDCATNLNRWGKDLALRFRRDIRLTKQQMEYYREGTDDSSFAAFTASREKLLLLLQHEETFWRQRAKHFWLSERDLNTKYFHGVANGRTKWKHIDRLKADDGTWQETNEALAATAKAYFAALFTAQGSHVEPVVSSLESRISAEDNAQLTSPFTKEEFRLALFNMNPNKSPTPDGFNPGFYQKFWDLLGDDIYSTCATWLAQGVIPEEVHPTNIVLLPKKDCLETMRDLRPISLCNVLYRLLPKTLANRLRKVIHKVIGEEQSAFVRNQSIVDNILIAFETIHYMKTKQRTK
ncbi:Transposon TX1 uncharacterized 149 kDa protein [Linum grandiflorum]